MSQLTLSKAYLIGTLIEGMLFGILTTLFLHCLRDLTVRRRTANINYIMLVSACIMWLGCSIHFGIAVQRTITAFVYSQDMPGGPEAYLNEENTVLWLASEGVFLCVNTAADLLLVYRCWLIWGNNYWVIIGPSCSILGSVIAGCIALTKMGELQPGQTIGLPSLVESADALFSFTLVTNVVTTALIAARIIHLIRKNIGAIPRGHTRQYISIVGMVIESGALMAITQAVFLGLWSTQNLVLWCVYAELAQIMAISPMLIIVRASSSANANNPAVSVIAPVFSKANAVCEGGGLSISRPPERPIILTEIETHRDPNTRGLPYGGADFGAKKSSDRSLVDDWQA